MHVALDGAHPLGVHARVRVELVLAALARVEGRLEDVDEELEGRAQRVLRRRALRLQVGHQVRQQLVEDGRQAVLVVEEEVVQRLHDVDLGRRERVARVEEHAHAQPRLRKVRRARRRAHARLDQQRRRRGGRGGRAERHGLAVVVDEHGGRPDHLDPEQPDDRVRAQLPHLPCGVIDHVLRRPRARRRPRHEARR